MTIHELRGAGTDEPQGPGDPARLGARALMAAVNAQIDRLHGSFDLADAEFFCECGDLTCTERVIISRGEYELRLAAGRALISPVHGRLHRLERIVDSHASLARAKHVLGRATSASPSSSASSAARRPPATVKATAWVESPDA